MIEFTAQPTSQESIDTSRQQDLSSLSKVHSRLILASLDSEGVLSTIISIVV